jgi:type IV pilus assembly protein PilP
MKALRLTVPLLALALAACSGDSFDDLRDYMKKTEATLPHQIDPLPVAKAYEPFTYDDFSLADPFRPRVLSNEVARNTSANAPDTARPRDALERFPLDALKMVGVLQQKGQTFALVRADGILYRVKTGDHLGLDFGVITAISEREIALKENIQDATGEWTLRASRLQLAEATAQENRK